MNAIAMVLALAAGPGIYEESDLPRSLAEAPALFTVTDLPRSLGDVFVEATPTLRPAAPVELEFWVGGHIGIFGALEATNGLGFIIGAQGRVHILPWLGAEVVIDFDIIEQGVLGVPVQFDALLYPPIEGKIRPYGVVGMGFIVYSGGGFSDAFFLFNIGFGVEYELQPNIMLDSSLRFGIVDTASNFIQWTVGIKFKLSN
jgi:hypothetical protein